MILVPALLVLLPPRGADADDPGELLRRASREVQGRIERSMELWPAHSTWEDPWVITRGSFTVRSPLGNYIPRSVADNLARIEPSIIELLGAAPPKGRRFVQEIYATLKEYNDKGGELQDGNAAYHSSSYGSVFARELPDEPVVTYDPASIPTLTRWATHGAVHQVLAAVAKKPLPFWVEEGLASYLTMYWDRSFGDANLAPFQRMREEGRALGLIGLKELTPNDCEQAHYVQLAVLFHWLMNVSEDSCTYRDPNTGEVVDAPFLTWIQGLVAGKDVRDTAFQELVDDPQSLHELATGFQDWNPLD